MKLLNTTQLTITKHNTVTDIIQLKNWVEQVTGSEVFKRLKTIRLEHNKEPLEIFRANNRTKDRN